MVPLWRDRAPHQVEKIGREQRVPLQVIDRQPALIRNGNFAEARFPQPLGEDTLRHRTGNSASPGLRVDDHFRRQILLDDDVGHRDPSARTQDTEGLEDHAALPR